jgi:hypothetical protein
MKTVAIILVPLLAAITAQADSSYTVARRAGGASVAGNPQTWKYYCKGQKMRIESGDTVKILDFDSRMVTNIDRKAKTISVTAFAASRFRDKIDKIDVKETGQKKKINGYDAHEVVVTVDVESPELPEAAIKMEMDVWLSGDVPGAGESNKFYKKNAEGFPWAALSGDGNRAIEVGLAGLQEKVIELTGVPLLEVVKVTPNKAGAQPLPQLTEAQRAHIRDTIAQLDQIQQKGGPDGQVAGREMARMLEMIDPAPTGMGPLGFQFQITMEYSDFSAGTIPDSLFAVPAGYRKIAATAVK